MRKLTNVLDECLEKHEDDLKLIVSNLIREALSGKQWAIELVMQYVVKPLLDHPNSCDSRYYELAGMSNNVKANH